MLLKTDFQFCFTCFLIQGIKQREKIISFINNTKSLFYIHFIQFNSDNEKGNH